MPNQDLLAMADDLVVLRTQVRARMNDATADESDALFLQILEINHRISMIDQILFKAATEDFSSFVQEIADQTDEIEKAIHEIEKIRKITGAIKNLLGIVDSVIDLVA
jgi:methionine salvage enolase-phosphatase E1